MADILFLHIMLEEWSTPLEIRTPRHLLVVARERSMTRTAEQLHITQPTLSKQMKSLECELGSTLFTRRSFSIALIEEGRLLRHRTEDLVTMADRITDEFLGLDDVLDGGLYLGLAESHQVCFLARGVKRLKESCPGVWYHITSDDIEQMTGKLDKDLLDSATLAEEPDTARYEALDPPKADRWGIITHADGELTRRTHVSTDDLEGLPLFYSEQFWAADLPRWAGAYMAELRLEGAFRLAYNGSVSAREGLGHLLTFVRLVDTGEDSGLVFRPLWPVLESSTYLIWCRQQVLPLIARRFLTQVSTAPKEESTDAGRY